MKLLASCLMAMCLIAVHAEDLPDAPQPVTAPVVQAMHASHFSMFSPRHVVRVAHRHPYWTVLGIVAAGTSAYFLYDHFHGSAPQPTHYIITPPNDPRPIPIGPG